ncbi:hypothetical protein HNO53_05975 [Billgrantia antri]|uniref:NADH:quinone oxidoreductase/Mrp antiporter transmembrane domain-containing protein n=1 Tax=Halomonas sulfidivorans TaxID=2733488 RepID=A0ABX7WDB7_9GAMM|nr:complex I subunit 5 family protein [Halomonas sulfidivorans]QTP58300.1 hypothetical protein HNO53_05975 [Halomonas sulfidivorans]
MNLLLPVALLWPLLVMLHGGLRLALVKQEGRNSRSRLELLGVGWWSAPLPALLLALWPGELSVSMPGWMLGGLWQLDEARRPWLLFGALLWLLAGWYARGYLADERRQAGEGDANALGRLMGFTLLWPLTLAGNLLLILAEDIPSFYLGFVTMTLAAYGLVVHRRDREARLGGLAYIVLALIGEGMILAGLLWSAGSTEALTLTELRVAIGEAERGVWMATLLWLGFGVKAGVIGLHVWLPLAHPVAPTPASAVLSGVMVKAGVLGWLSTLPLGSGEAGLARLGDVIIVAGLFGAFGAALLGVIQRHPKAVLAYSSVSQLGMLASLVGVGLAAPDAWPALLAPVTLFAGHHGMTKGALFFGVGISEHPPRLPAWLIVTLLALPALSLGGALTSGLIAKGFIKEALKESEYSSLVSWLSVAAVGSTLLVARALWRQWRRRGEPGTPLRSPMCLAWLFAVLAAAAVPLWLPLGESVHWPMLSDLPGLLWPAALGLGLSGLALLAAKLGEGEWRLSSHLPPGDLWWGYAALARRMRSGLVTAGGMLESRGLQLRARLVAWEHRAIARLDGLARYERRFSRLAVPLMIGLALLLLLGFWLG